MIAQPDWMRVDEYDPTAPRTPAVREVETTIDAAGFECHWAQGEAWELYLVRHGSRTARLILDRAQGTLEVWDRLDPNGAPGAWGRFRASRSTGATEALALLRQIWPD